MKARGLDRKLDTGDDISKHLNLAATKRINEWRHRVYVDSPAEMHCALTRKGKAGASPNQLTFF